MSKISFAELAANLKPINSMRQHRFDLNLFDVVTVNDNNFYISKHTQVVYTAYAYYIGQYDEETGMINISDTILE
jgi:hypothetical protein